MSASGIPLQIYPIVYPFHSRSSPIARELTPINTLSIPSSWLASMGMDYLKEDSCCGSQDHDTAFSDYAEMRDALNATGAVFAT